MLKAGGTAVSSALVLLFGLFAALRLHTVIQRVRRAALHHCSPAGASPASPDYGWAHAQSFGMWHMQSGYVGRSCSPLSLCIVQWLETSSP